MNGEPANDDGVNENDNVDENGDDKSLGKMSSTPAQRRRSTAQRTAQRTSQSQFTTSSFDVTYTRSPNGLSLPRVDPTSGQFPVVSKPITAESLAAGIVPGDTICAVNGLDVRTMTWEGMWNNLRVVPNTIRFVRCVLSPLQQPASNHKDDAGEKDAKSRPLLTPSPPPAFHSQPSFASSYAAAPIKMPTAGRMSRIASSARGTNRVSSMRRTIGGSGGGESPSVAEVVVGGGGGGAVGFPGFLRLDDDRDDEDL